MPLFRSWTHRAEFHWRWDKSRRHTALAETKAVKHTWIPPRAADGHPDLQGFWANNSATPLERPKELAGRAFLTDEEVAAFKKKAGELFNGQGDAAFGDTVFQTVLANVNGTKSGFKSTDGDDRRLQFRLDGQEGLG